METFIDLKVDGKSMRTMSVGGKSKRGLIVLQEVFGINQHIQSVARRFAEEGYQVLAPELFHRTAPAGFTCGYTEFQLAQPHFSVITNQNLVADAKACFEHLKNEMGCEDIYCIGYCLGGRATYICNSEIPFRAVVSYYGSRIAENLSLAPNQKSPILLAWGGLDKNIPKVQRIAIAEALTKAEKSFVEIEFSKAEHGFFCEARQSYNAAAAKQVWPLTLEFLRSN